MEIKKIVTPVDFNSVTGKLVDYAVYVAGRLDAEINFCHVIEPISMGDMMLGSPSFQEFEEKKKAHSNERMSNIVNDNKEKCSKVSGRILSGDVVDEIVKFAEEEGADLIILGTHGAKGLEKILLGRVAERVMQNAHCPCLVMNPFK
jgi:nucleotide-binding universal stress UspA family protein